MRQARITATAVEWNGAHTQERVYYGTYARDIPDPTFRFSINVVEHTYSLNLHQHEYAELIIVLGGRALHLTEFGNHAVNDADVIVINPNVRHGFQDPQGLKLCLIMYDPRQLLTGHEDLRQMTGYRALFEPRRRAVSPGRFAERLRLSADELLYVASPISILRAEFEGRADGRRAIIKSTFVWLVAYLSRLYATRNHDHRTPLLRMTNVVSHIGKHFREPLAVDELARIAHLSASQFQRNFKRTYNTTPVHFINQMRILEACEMLEDPNRDITEIAFETGFCSSSFFATQFKRYMGESPSQFRRKKLSERSRPDASNGFGEALNWRGTAPGIERGVCWSAPAGPELKPAASSRSAPPVSFRR
ncbi:MAG TPA: AraC family transcriptional regulator [Verrucomicrobiae bacterium]|nr:AraC family transcriptional regulator [Verrucomicrobiae bacterium]